MLLKLWENYSHTLLVGLKPEATFCEGKFAIAIKLKMSRPFADVEK